MNAEAIQALGMHDEVAPATVAPRATPGAPDFTSQVSQGLQELNQQLLASQVIDYVAAKGTVAPKPEGRIVSNRPGSP